MFIQVLKTAEHNKANSAIDKMVHRQYEKYTFSFSYRHQEMAFAHLKCG
jgi:hypothetical protein